MTQFFFLKTNPKNVEHVVWTLHAFEVIWGIKINTYSFSKQKAEEITSSDNKKND